MPSRNKPYEGLFLTIEGGDGCGKTTLAHALAEALQKKGYTVVKTREPGGTPLAEEIRTLVLDSKKEMCERSELLLFLAARAEHSEKVILPALRAGKVVICERFNDSSIAYQGCARNLGMTYVEELCALASAHLVPDATFFLDLDPQVGLNRVSEGRGEPLDRLEQEKLQFHKQVRQGYLHLADQHPERIIVLDALDPPEHVRAKALNALESHLMLKLL